MQIEPGRFSVRQAVTGLEGLRSVATRLLPAIGRPFIRDGRQRLPHFGTQYSVVCNSDPRGRTKWYGTYTEEQYLAQRQSEERAKWAASVRTLTGRLDQAAWEGSPLDPPALLSGVTVVIISPRKPVSVGTVARGCGSFECEDLRIVMPRQESYITRRHAKSASKGAQYILYRAGHYDSIAEATADCDVRIAFTRWAQSSAPHVYKVDITGLVSHPAVQRVVTQPLLRATDGASASLPPPAAPWTPASAAAAEAAEARLAAEAAAVTAAEATEHRRGGADSADSTAVSSWDGEEGDAAESYAGAGGANLRGAAGAVSSGSSSCGAGDGSSIDRNPSLSSGHGSSSSCSSSSSSSNSTSSSSVANSAGGVSEGGGGGGLAAGLPRGGAVGAVTASAAAGRPAGHHAGPRPPKIALVFGREELGMSDQEVDSCEVCCSVPIGRLQESLSLSHAVSIALCALYQARLQHLASGGAAAAAAAAASFNDANDANAPLSGGGMGSRVAASGEGAPFYSLDPSTGTIRVAA